MKDQIRVSEQSSYFLILGEPYVIYGRMGYVPVIDVQDIHKGNSGYLIISAVSLSEQLHEIQVNNSNVLKGLSISINKENASRMARYIVSCMS